MTDSAPTTLPPEAARIAITPNLALDPREVRVEFVRASGPGGQNVNKVATAGVAFDVRHCSRRDVRRRTGRRR
jgi:ribosome-associated protein